MVVLGGGGGGTARCGHHNTWRITVGITTLGDNSREIHISVFPLSAGSLVLVLPLSRVLPVE